MNDAPRHCLSAGTAALALALAAVAASAGPALTPTETLWLDLATPALRHARQQGLPLDIVVQPAARPGEPPLALGWHEGRCKLVLSMRGNPGAQATLDAVAPELLGAAVEAMTAHELGHCWRYVQGAWHTVPAGFAAPPAMAGSRLEMEQARREEGFADLVGLAWTARAHPQAYAAVHQWLLRLRAAEPVAGGHHDTLAWVRLASDPGVFAAAASGSPFEQALPPWRAGLDAAAR